LRFISEIGLQKRGFMMQKLAQRDLKSGQVVLTKGKRGYFPQFFVNWQFDSKFGVGPVCNWFLSFKQYGDFSVFSEVYCYSDKLKLFTGEKVQIGDIIIVYKGGGYSDTFDIKRLDYSVSNSYSNWCLAYYCGIMNGKIIAAQIYNDKTNNFTNIKAYPAMGKYIQ
jgi:hypothetical protein